MKTAVYARYSSHSQSEQSIEGQLRDCYAYAKSHGLVIVKEYIDRAITGTVDDRPNFQQMLIDAEHGGFEAILTWKTDRFARNRYDSIIYKANLKKQGIKLFYAKEEIPDGPEGIIMESLLEALAEYYVAEMRVKIIRGLRESALKCKYTGGTVALGYSIDEEGKYYINDTYGPVILKIFLDCSRGTPLVEIINELNSLGFKTAKGKPFNKNSLRRILKNKKYLGVYKYGSVEIQDGIPAIVPVDLFEAVQEKLKGPVHNGRYPKIKYLLSGKLFCGACGSQMIGESGTARDKTLRGYYKCKKRKFDKTCKATPVKREWLEDLVVNETVKNILNKETIELIADRCVAIQLEANNENLKEKDLKRQLATVEKSIANMLNAIEAGIFTPSTADRLKQLEANKDKLEYELAVLSAKPPTITKEQLIFMLNKFTDKDYNDARAREWLINTFVAKVVYYENEKLEIYYNLNNKNDAPFGSETSLLGGANETVSDTIIVYADYCLLRVLLQ